MPTGGSLRVAYSDGVAVFAQGTAMTAFDAETGRTLWTGKLQKTSHHCPEDLFIIDGQIWSPNTGKPQQNGTHFKVIDLHSGEIKKDFVAENIQGFPMHPRCYPSRARRTLHHDQRNGYRVLRTRRHEGGRQQYGSRQLHLRDHARQRAALQAARLLRLLLPVETRVLLRSGTAARRRGGIEAGNRLEKGPAYGKIERPESEESRADWPMYRRDATRSGCNPTPVAAELKEAWKVELGGKLTQPVVADAEVFVAA